jgi:hypothetical protein
VWQSEVKHPRLLISRCNDCAAPLQSSGFERGLIHATASLHWQVKRIASSH